MEEAKRLYLKASIILATLITGSIVIPIGISIGIAVGRLILKGF